MSKTRTIIKNPLPIGYSGMFAKKSFISLVSLVFMTPIALSGCASPESSQPANTSETTIETAATDETGILKLVANGEDFVRQGFITKDGWQITFDNVFVTLADVIAYQTDPPYNPDSDKAIASKTKVFLLEGDKIIDLAEGDINADPLVITEVKAPTGMYNALAWKVVQSDNGESEDQAILLKGKAEKEGKILEFAIAFDKELNYSCGEFVGDERKGIVKDSATAEMETTFHFDHIFGDAEAPTDDAINTDSIGFDPFIPFAKDGKITVDLATLKENLDPTTYQTLEKAIAGLGHVGEGHCKKMNND